MPEERIFGEFKCSICGEKYQNTGAVNNLCLKHWFEKVHEDNERLKENIKAITKEEDNG